MQLTISDYERNYQERIISNAIRLLVLEKGYATQGETEQITGIKGDTLRWRFHDLRLKGYIRLLEDRLACRVKTGKCYAYVLSDAGQKFS